MEIYDLFGKILLGCVFALPLIDPRGAVQKIVGVVLTVLFALFLIWRY